MTKAIATVCAAVAVAVCAPLAWATGAAGPNPAQYADPSGDSNSAPDITNVLVTDNGNGTYGFEVDLATVQDLADGADVAVFIDADNNPATGDAGLDGAEYLFFAQQQGAGLAKWDGTQFSQFTHQPTNPSLSGGKLTFTVTAADIGGATSFHFFVASIHGNDIDNAPDGGATYAFPAAAAVPLTIQRLILPAALLVAKAGTLYSARAVTVGLSDGTITKPDRLACSLKIAGKAVKPIASCQWRIPKSDRNKNGVLTITVSYQQQTVKQSIPVTVR